MRPGCKFEHSDVPADQRAAAMEVKHYSDEVNKYFADKREQEALEEAKKAAEQALLAQQG